MCWINKGGYFFLYLCLIIEMVPVVAICITDRPTHPKLSHRSIRAVEVMRTNLIMMMICRNCCNHLATKLEGFRRPKLKLNSARVTWAGIFLLFCIDKVGGFYYSVCNANKEFWFLLHYFRTTGPKKAQNRGVTWVGLFLIFCLDVVSGIYCLLLVNIC